MTDTSATRPRFVLECIYYVIAIFFFVYLFYLLLDQRRRPDPAGDDAGAGHLRAVRPQRRCARTISIRACRRRPITSSPRSTSPARSPSPTTCTPNTTRSAPSAPATGIRPTCSWAALMTVLVLEYSRKRHMPLFVLNIMLMLYAVYGYVVPGMFYHAGLSWWRVVTAMSVETTTGVFSNLPQIALTVVGAFLLVLSTLSGFGCIELLLRATKRVAIRSPHALPQSAVIGSMCVGTVSGSGAANAITIGSATIPGHDRRRHAAGDRGGDRVRRPRSAAS